MNQQRHSGIATINHWLTVVLVTIMLALGYLAAGAPSDAVEGYVMRVHVALGFFVLLFVLWRTVFRLYEGFPATLGRTAPERWLAYLVHRLVLALLVLQVLTGPLYLFTENECIDVFGWFAVCVPLESLAIIHGSMEWLHKLVGLYLLPGLLALHVVGAIRHYLDRRAERTLADL